MQKKNENDSGGKRGSQTKNVPFFGQISAYNKKPSPIAQIADRLLPHFPELKKKLYIANIQITPANFMARAIISSVYFGIALTVLCGFLFNVLEISLLLLIILVPLFFAGSFMFLTYYPDAKISQRRRDIDVELVFAGRHILIAMRAGMPLFEALVGVSSGYGVVSEEFKKVVNKVGGGVPLGQALREVGLESTNSAFTRITQQLSNALASGADAAFSLEIVLDQISKEQTISLKAYGQKLNPMIMFFMIFGIIFPSLGVAFAIILFSLVSSGTITMNSLALMYIFAFIAVVQFFFLMLVEGSRPKYIL